MKSEGNQQQNQGQTQQVQNRKGLIQSTPLTPTKIGPLLVSAWTHIGKRNNQEDRFVVCPNLCNGEYAFFGVFDGTVKEHASDFVHKAIVDCLLSSPSFVAFDSLSPQAKVDPENKHLLHEAIQQMYAATDAKLLSWCKDNEYHYSSTTSVTVLLHHPTQRLWAAHLGDSKIIMGQVLVTPTSDPLPEGFDDLLSAEPTKEGDQPSSSSSSSDGGRPRSLSRVSGMALTIDHKPDQPEELRRIEQSGGSLTYLHGGKPFIRGGDFSQRKHAMQLNYSRAFGGKDLKMYGLSAVPTVTEYKLNRHRDKLIVLGSDGVWDVVDPDSAAKVAEQARRQQLSPAEELGKQALRNHEQRGSADNVTCIVVFIGY